MTAELTVNQLIEVNRSLVSNTIKYLSNNLLDQNHMIGVATSTLPTMPEPLLIVKGLISCPGF